MNGMDEMQRRENERLANPPPSLRELFLANLMKAPSLDENGYICTKGEALKAFDSALAVVRNRESFTQQLRKSDAEA